MQSRLLSLLCFITLSHWVSPLPPQKEAGEKYKEVLRLSLLFYKAQRSGYLPDNDVPWRKNSALEDKGQNGEDLTGGYYDASDFVKFSYTMAFTTTILSWGFLSYEDAYGKAGQHDQVLDAIKWATDYFVKCHVSKYELYGQVGDFATDHKFWGRPEDLNMTRPAYKIDRDQPGSDLAGEVAAALASASIAFQNSNRSYSLLLLQHAEELYQFANEYTGLYNEALPGAKSFYESNGYGDELTWAAIWLYKATQEKRYLDEAQAYYYKYKLKERPNEFFYNKKVAGIQVLLAKYQPDFLDSVKDFCNYIVRDQKRTPLGLVFVDKFGTLSHAANVAFICLQAADLNVSPRKYIYFAKQQIDYILGSSGRSYVVGFGRNYPRKPHHSASSCPDRPLPCGWDQARSTQSNPQILYGALVSGPDQKDHYEDVREEYLYNEVTIDYNAGFQSALAGLIHHLTDRD